MCCEENDPEVTTVRLNADVLGANGGRVKTSLALYIFHVFIFETNLFLIMRDTEVVVYASGSGIIYIYTYSGVGDNCGPVNIKNCFGFVIGRRQ